MIKKVLYIALVELEISSGPVVHTVNVIDGLKLSGIDVMLACPKPGDFKSRKSSKFQFLSFYGYSNFRLFLFNVLSIPAIVKQMITFRPDVIYVRDRPGNIITAVIAKMMQKPFVVEVNGYLERDFISSGKYSLYHMIRKIHFSLASGFIFNCPKVRELYSKRFHIQNAKTSIINMFVDCNHFAIRPMEEFRHQLNIPANEIIFGYVGGFSPRHNIEILLDLLKEFHLQGVEARLLLVGGGMPDFLREKIENHPLQNRIIQTGWVNHNEVPKYINAMNVGTAFINSFKGNGTESFLKVKEYLACGIPVILNGASKKDFMAYPQGAVSVVEGEDVFQVSLQKLAALIIGMSKLEESDRLQFSDYIKSNFCLQEVGKLTLVAFNDFDSAFISKS